MKFLICLLAIFFIINISSKLLISHSNFEIDSFLNKITDYRYSLPDEESIKKIDNRLLIRISLPSDGLKAKSKHFDSKHFSFIFKADDNLSFIITNFNEILFSFTIRYLIFTLKSFWVKGNLGDHYELFIICTKDEKTSFFENEKQKKKEYLILSFQVEINLSTQNDFSQKFFSNFLDQFQEESYNNKKLNANDILSSIDNKFIYYKEKLNIPEDKNKTVFNHFIYKNPLRISKQFANDLRDNFMNSSQFTNTTQFFKRTKDFVHFKNEDFLKEDFIYPKLVEIDPDLLVKNYREEKKQKSKQFLFDAYSFNEYLKINHKNMTYSNATLIQAYLANYQELDQSISSSQDKLIKAFKEIYEDLKVQYELSKLVKVAKINFKNKTIDKNTKSQYKPNNKNITLDNNNNTIHNRTSSSPLMNELKIKNVTIHKSNITIPHNKTISSSSLSYSNSNNTKKIKLNNKNTTQNIVNSSTFNKTIYLNKTAKIIPKVINTNEHKNNTACNCKITHNDTSNKNEGNIHNRSDIYLIHKNLPQIKKKILSNSNKNINYTTPFLKNEKIRIVNGSLVLIQTLMLGNQNERLADIKEKFNKILNNEIN